MDRQELERIAARYGDTLYRVALQYLRHGADAEDILQDVLLECCGRRPAFASEDHERYWLIRVTINKCKNLLRQRKRRHIVSLHHAEAIPAPPEPSYRALYDAVNALPRDQRMAVELFYGQGYAAAEIAELLDARESTVRTWLRRARLKLREQLKEAWDDDEF